MGKNSREVNTMLENQLIRTRTHNELMTLCQLHGGEFIPDEPGSGRITYRFCDNLWIDDYYISWNEFDNGGICVGFEKIEERKL